jgi:hypothetical protein
MNARPFPTVMRLSGLGGARPTGFEPVTFGFVGRGGSSVGSSGLRIRLNTGAALVSARRDRVSSVPFVALGRRDFFAFLLRRHKLQSLERFVSRGFTGRRRTPEELADRLPPGQYAEDGFPVLTAGPTPGIAPDEWSFRIDGMVGQKREWTWEEFHRLLFEQIPCDIHCVTKWSKLGTNFGGVSMDLLLEEAEPLDPYAMVMPMAATRPTSPSRTSPMARRGSSPSTRVSRYPGSTAGRRASSFRISTSGRARSGCRGCGSWTTTSPASGRATATTTAAIPGRSSAIGPTDGRTSDPGRAASPGRWQIGTVTSIKQETPRVKSFRIELPMWMAHLPGQHYDVRLTAPDGYRAQRSYSIASSPLDEGEIELTVDRL